jgi:hypothetical protein
MTRRVPPRPPGLSGPHAASTSGKAAWSACRQTLIGTSSVMAHAP